MDSWKPFGKRIVMAIASGYILMYFSEFYFLNEGPGAEFVKKWTTDPLSIPGWLLGFSLYYAGWGFIMLTAIGLCRVRSFWSLFIAGALFGWAVEGIVIPVIYENMPGSIGWPSLGWHALVDVWLGWYLIRKILQKNNYWYTTITAVALGLFWGVWSTWYWVGQPPPGETAFPPIPADVYVPYALALGVLLILAYIIMDKAGGREFKPSITEIVLLTIWHVWGFCFGAVAAAPVAIYVLPTLFAGGILVLWWNRATETRSDIFATLSGRVGWGHYALLLLIPVCAIPVYTIFYRLDLHVPIVHIVAVPLMCAGNVLLVISVVMVARRRRPHAAVQVTEDTSTDGTDTIRE